MTIQIYLYLAVAQTVLSAIVAFGALIRYRSRSFIVKLIGFVFLTSFLANMAAWLMVGTALRIFVNSTYPVSLIITIGLYSRIYYDLLHKKNRGWFVLVACVFAVFALVNILFIQKTTPNSYTYLFHSAIMITYCLLYFYVLMQDLPSLYVHQLPMFWFNAGLLVFHAGTFFLFSFHAYLVNVLKNNMLIYWSFHNMLSNIEHIIFLIGLYYDLRWLRRKGPALPTEV
ncbi:MAG TPA: hypothetical protein VFG46_22415 [Chryseolinea sp.]|nr:hypothetical protein [Chryseolinea sp.]